MGARDRYLPLDLLRGIAILGVVTFHTFIIFKFKSTVFDSVFGLGVYGVQLFFFVSAMTMCMMWDRRAGEANPTFRFYIRRVFRIAPPFWLALIGYLSLFGFGPSRWSPEGVLWQQIAAVSLFLHPFWPTTVNAVVPGGWSIGVEMFFYLWFPLLFRWTEDYRRYLIAALAMYLVNIFIVRTFYGAALQEYQHQELIDEFFYFQFFNQAPIFLVGIALYKSKLLYQNFWAMIIAFWLVTAFVLKYVFHQPSAPFFFTVVFSLLGLVWAALKCEWSFRPLNRLGEFSYSIYLLHFAIIFFVELSFRQMGLDLHSVSSFLAALSTTMITCWIAGSVANLTIEKLATNAAQKIIAAS